MKEEFDLQDMPIPLNLILVCIVLFFGGFALLFIGLYGLLQDGEDK